MSHARQNARANNPLNDMSDDTQETLFAGNGSGKLQRAIQRRRSATSTEELESLSQEIELLTEELQASLRVEGSEYHFRRFTMTKTAVIAPKDLTAIEADEFGALLAGMDDAINWWRGFWANLYVDGIDDDNERGEIYDKLAEEFDMNSRTLRNCASVDRRVLVSRRRDTLSFSHHVEVASESPQEQSKWLARAEQGSNGKRWSVARLRKAIADSKAPLPVPSITERLHAYRESESKRALKLIDDGASREAVASLYEQIAQEIRSK